MLPFSIEELVRTYVPDMYRFVFRMTKDTDLTEDIVQEACIKCWQKSAQFDQEKSSPKTWIFTLTFRTALDYIRKNKTRRKYELTELDIFGNQESTTLKRQSGSDDESEKDLDSVYEGIEPLQDQIFQQKEIKEVVTRAVEHLKPESRIVISMHHESELTFKEIAEVTDTSINTIKSRYRRALEELRNLLLQEGVTGDSFL